jgi:hypothetical protein
MKNMDEVRQALTHVYEGLKNGNIKPDVANGMNNACGKIINTVNMELKYYALIKGTPKIRFLEMEPLESRPTQIKNGGQNKLQKPTP